MTAGRIFIFIGLIANTEHVEGIVGLDARRFVKTSGLAQISQKGIFAPEDCSESAIAVVAAVKGEGVLASYGIRNYSK